MRKKVGTKGQPSHTGGLGAAMLSCLAALVLLPLPAGAQVRGAIDVETPFEYSKQIMLEVEPSEPHLLTVVPAEEQTVVFGRIWVQCGDRDSEIFSWFFMELAYAGRFMEDTWDVDVEFIDFHGPATVIIGPDGELGVEIPPGGYDTLFVRVEMFSNKPVTYISELFGA